MIAGGLIADKEDIMTALGARQYLFQPLTRVCGFYNNLTMVCGFLLQQFYNNEDKDRVGD